MRLVGREKEMKCRPNIVLQANGERAVLSQRHVVLGDLVASLAKSRRKERGKVGKVAGMKVDGYLLVDRGRSSACGQSRRWG